MRAPTTMSTPRGRSFLHLGVLALCTLLGAPGLVAAQDRGLPDDPTMGMVFRAGAGPAATLATGLVGTFPLGPRLHLRGEMQKAFQGLESCEDEFPSSQRCASSPWSGTVGLSLRQPVGSWALGVNAGAGVHREGEAFGGAAPLVQLGGAAGRALGSAWVAEATLSWTRVRNDVWEERLGEPLQYVLAGVELRRRWRR